MPRLQTKWNKDRGARSFEDTAGALCMSIWKIASERVLNLENAGFDTTTNAQRLDILTEFAILAVHLLDRRAYQSMDDDDRTHFVTAIAKHFSGIVQDNRADLQGPGQYRDAFIALLNQRCDEYAQYQCDGDTAKPGFSMSRVLGEHISKLMGDKDNQWIPDYVIDKEVPELHTDLQRASRVIFN